MTAVLKSVCLATVLIAITVGQAQGRTERLTQHQRQELTRELAAEYGTAKVLLPRSKKPLMVRASGQFDRFQWSEAMMKFGPAARVGDLVQITAITFESKRVVFTINYGIGGGRKWWHRIQVAGATRGTTLGQTQNTHAPGGTKLALVFHETVPVKTAEEFKEMLKPVLDFELRTATELYLDTIEPRFREAIEREEIIEGMDKEMALLAKGKPRKKVRGFEDGIETEDWIFGEPPGELMFVTFLGGEVIEVKTMVAAIGGQVKEYPQIER